MSQTIAITQGTTEVLEGVQYLFAGDEPVFAVTKLGVSTIANDDTLGMDVYKGSSPKTSTYTTGNMSASGNVAITKTFRNLVGGDELYVTLHGTCDGMLMTFAAFRVFVRKLSGR